MDRPPADAPISESELPPHLKRLRMLVTVLTLVMIAGVITITALLVIRLGNTGTPVVIDPGGFAVPDGVGTVGISVIDGRTVLIGDDGVIRVFDSDSRALLEELEIATE